MPDASELYKIGTVARMTGIAVERLRAWERRYGLTPASREGKTRYYSSAQVDRLSRIKRLIDQGHPVSTLINLSAEVLSERLQIQAAEQQPEAVSPRAPTVGLVGTQLLMLEQTSSEVSRIRVTSRWVNLDQCAAALTGAATPPDALVVVLGSVNSESVEQLQKLPAASNLLVVYHYGTEAGIELASNQGWLLLRWPVQWADLEQAVARAARAPLQAGKRAARHFSDEELLTIASASSTLTQGSGCACPAELVHLISALNAFSDHSLACVAAPDADGPQQARIAETTSQARLQLELALEEWVSAEGLVPRPN